MTRNLCFCLIIVFVTLLFTSGVYAQSQPDTTKLKKLIHYISELEYQAALNNYVEDLFVDYGIENLPQERYLVSLMRLVNKEMRQRIENPGKARTKYFNKLESQSEEIEELKSRLKEANITELNPFINELQARIKLSVKSGMVDYKKKRVFEDALQLLYVAEEMIKLDKLREPETLNQKISKSKDKLLNAFGEVGNVESVQLDVAPNLFNLFQEWKKTQSYKFTARLMDVKIARTNLIKTGSLPQVQRMFNNQLRLAYTAFNKYDYDYADRLLEDLTETYRPAGVKDFEDIYYYWAESNFALKRFLRAEEIYKRLLQNYQNSSFLPQVYSRLIQINYKLNRYDDALNYYSNYQNVASTNERNYFDIQFIAALTYYNKGDYNPAVDILLSFPRTNTYYHLAQYMVGTMYAASQNYDLAEEVLTSLTSLNDTPKSIYNRAHYKLGLINYEQSRFLTGINHLNAITQNFNRYDKVLNALAWSHFKLQRDGTIPPNSADYSKAIQYANRLKDQFYGSEFRMEAESLLAYIYQIQNKPSVALTHYRDVYESKLMKRDASEFLEEKERLESLHSEAIAMKQQAFQANDPNAFVKAADLADNLQQQLWELDAAELSPVGSAVSTEINDILSQLNQLQDLQEEAEKDGNKYALAKIDTMTVRLTAVLDLFPQKYLKNMESYNWFDAYPVTRKVVDDEFRSTKNEKLKKQLLQEMQQTDKQISRLWQEVERAKAQSDFEQVVGLERKIDQLAEIRKQYDQLYVSAFELSDGEVYQDFDKWGDFGAFGIIDVNFGQRNRLQDQLTGVSQLYNSVVDVLNKRRTVVEDKLKKIEAEIRFMTMKARLEERKRLRAEREREFRETYFDERTSEFEEK